MSEHATPITVQYLAIITRDTAKSLAATTDRIVTMAYSIQQPELLNLTFSDLASRIDDISRLADQLDKLALNIENALTAPTPTS